MALNKGERMRKWLVGIVVLLCVQVSIATEVGKAADSVVFVPGSVTCDALRTPGCKVTDNVQNVKALSLGLVDAMQSQYDSYFIPNEYRGEFASVILTGALTRWLEIPLVAIGGTSPNDYIEQRDGFIYTRHFKTADDKRHFRAIIYFVNE